MSTTDIIREYISKEMLQRPLENPLSDDDQLVESGVIDSLGVMTLLSFIEEKFAMQIQGDDLIPENFASISKIAALVDRELQQ